MEGTCLDVVASDACEAGGIARGEGAELVKLPLNVRQPLTVVPARLTKVALALLIIPLPLRVM